MEQEGSPIEFSEFKVINPSSPDQMESISSEEDALISEFLDDMIPTKLFWRSGNYKDSWTFWSQEVSTNWAIRERIVTALCRFCTYSYPLIGDRLIQFWAAEMIGGRRHLTTILQPFSLKNLTNEKFIQYRKISVGSNLVVVEGENMEGIIGRVFRNQLPEGSPDLSNYFDTEYPQRALALSCGFKSTMVLPVLEPSQQCCVGVLELLDPTNVITCNIHHLVSQINKALKEVHLETVVTKRLRSQIQNVYEGHVEEEIKDALIKVCKKHDLPFALVWVRCARSSCVDNDGFSPTSYNVVQVSCEGELLVSIPNMLFISNMDLLSYLDTSSAVPLNVRQGLVGKAVLSHKPYLCRDVCELSITEYPLVHCVRKSGLIGCFAVGLRTISTGSQEYVIEFFLPRNETYIGDLHKFLSSILTTMKQHFKTFEVVTGDIGNDLFIEVDQFTFHKEFESFTEFPTTNTQLEFEALRNDGEVLQSDSIHHQLVIEDFDVLEQPEVAISLENIPPVKQLKAQNQEKNNSCSRKDLEQHFGKSLWMLQQFLVVERVIMRTYFSFSVSRSTVKRWCREHNIDRWPSPKRSKVNSLSSTPNQTELLTRGNVEPISQDAGRDPSCSEPPTNVPLMPTTSTVTVKATYEKKIIKFKLSYSSTMADLEEKVNIRTRLGGGTFRMTYLDEENDPISIACDEDLHDCMEDLRLSGRTTIRMQIEPIANRSP